MWTALERGWPWMGKMLFVRVAPADAVMAWREKIGKRIVLPDDERPRRRKHVQLGREEFERLLMMLHC